MSYSFSGTGGGIVTVAAYTFIPQFFEKRRSLALGVMQMGVGSGAFLFPNLVNLLLDEYGYQGAMILLGAVNLNIIVCGAIFRPPDRPPPTLEEAIHSSVSMRLGGSRLDNTQEQTAPFLLTTSNIEERGSIEDDHTCVTLLTTEKPLTQLSSTSGIKGEMQLSQDTLTLKKPLIHLPAESQKTCSNENGTESRDLIKGENVAAKRHGLKCACGWSPSGVILDPTLILFMLVCISFVMCVSTLLSFLPSLSMEKGLDHNKMVLILSTIGIAEFAGTLPCGFFFDIPIIRQYRRNLYTVFVGLFAITVILDGLLNEAVWLTVLAGFQGCLKGVGFGQLSVVVADMFGIDRMVKIFGFTWATMGVFSISWPFFAGKYLLFCHN